MSMAPNGRSYSAGLCTASLVGKTQTHAGLQLIADTYGHCKALTARHWVENAQTLAKIL